MSLSFVFCHGAFDPRGHSSVAIEWRDYVDGLSGIGVPCCSLDVLCAPSTEIFFGALAFVRTLTRGANLVRPQKDVETELSAMSDEALVALAEGLQAWMEGTEPPPPIVSTVTSSAEDMDAFLSALSEEWNRLLDSVESRLPADESSVLGRLPAAEDDLLVVLDFYDLRCWGSVLWRTVSERALRAAYGSGGAVRFVTRAMTESDRLSDAQAALLSTVDEVWVPSSFHLPVFERAGAAKAVVVPESFDETFFSRAAMPPSTRGPREGLTFLMLSHYRPAFGLPSWNEVRKAAEVTLEAFLREFGGVRGARLVVKGAPDVPELRSAIVSWMESRAIDGSFASQLELVGFCDAERLRELYADADVFVGISRGEGWGRPLVEAMAMGVPCVAVRFSGPIEFLRDDSAYVVEAPLAPVARFFPAMVDWGNFADPSVDAIRAGMRAAAEDPERCAKGARAAEYVHAHYTRPAIAARMLSRARALFEGNRGD